MDNAIAKVDPYFNAQHWNVMKVMAETFIKSGALPAHIQNPAQLVMIMQTGNELGFKPMQSINNLYIVNGRVAMQSQAMLTKILESGIKLNWIKDTDTEAEVEFSGLDRTPYKASFTIAEADKAGLRAKPGSPWHKYPKAMLRARAVSLGARVFCPDIVSGSYTIEEVADITIAEDGTQIIQSAKTDLAGAVADQNTKLPAASEGTKPVAPQADPNLAIKRLIMAECNRLGIDLKVPEVKARLEETTGKSLDDPMNFPIILDALKEIPTPAPKPPESGDDTTPPPATDAPEAPKPSGEGTGEEPAAQTAAEDIIVPPTPDSTSSESSENEQEDPAGPEMTPVAEQPVIEAQATEVTPQVETSTTPAEEEKPEPTPAELKKDDIERRESMPEVERASLNSIGLFQTMLQSKEAVPKNDVDAQIGYLFMVHNIDIDRLDQLTAKEVSSITKKLMAQPTKGSTDA